MIAANLGIFESVGALLGTVPPAAAPANTALFADVLLSIPTQPVALTPEPEPEPEPGALGDATVQATEANSKTPAPVLIAFLPTMAEPLLVSGTPQSDANEAVTKSLPLKEASGPPRTDVMPVIISALPEILVASVVSELAPENAMSREIPGACNAPPSTKAAIIQRPADPASPAIDTQIVAAAPAVSAHAPWKKIPTSEKTDVSVVPTSDVRHALVLPTFDKAASPVPDRLPTFAPLIADAARDLATLAQDKDLRFNVRPEMLGPMTVTIERSDAGPTLRIAVETPSAAQAVRQAEPMMNDARGNAPFVQVTVDMNAPDSRGRSSRAMPPVTVRPDQILEQPIAPQPVHAARYA